MGRGDIITRDLGRNFQAAMRGSPIDQSDFAPNIEAVRQSGYEEGKRGAALVFRNGGSSYAASGVSAGPGMGKMASSGIVYTQPQFFSPIHTPINWQIPVKRKELYQWARFYKENEPKVAQALEFHSKFPINRFTNECQNRYVKRYFDKLTEKLKLLKWLRIMSDEVHTLGDAF